MSTHNGLADLLFGRTRGAILAPALFPPSQTGHHVMTIEPLELTINANPQIIQRFKTFNKRNKSVYDVAGAVSDQELDAMLKLANQLKLAR